MRAQLLWPAVAIAAATVAVFAQVHAFPFLNYDDALYVFEHAQVRAGLTGEGVVWAFREMPAGNWHPVTWLSHMLDHQLFGPEPGPRHVVNLLLHLANALLVLVWLADLTGAPGRSAFVAALFALHPLHVEPVAWIAERKELLAALFGLLALIAWGRFARRGSRGWQIGALAAFALSLGAKPGFATLPFALLLLDLWPLRRFGPGRAWPLVREKLPLFALALASVLLTLLAQPWDQFGGSIGLRLENAIVSWAVYLRQTLLPVGLSPFYPYPEAIPAGRLLLSLGVLAAVSGLALWRVRDRPWLLVGWLWFAGTLVPVIGLVQVGYQAHADRYTYLPLIGLFVIASWGGRELLERLGVRGTGLRAAAVLVAAACGVASYAQAQHWRSDLALFSHALAVTERNVLAHALVASALAGEGRWEEATVHYEEALAIQDARPDPAGGPAQQPRLRVYLALALERQERYAEAAEQYGAQLEILPDDVQALSGRARILATHPDPALRDGPAALAMAQRANVLTGYGNPRVLDILAAARAETGDFGAAVATATRAITIAVENGDSRSAENIAGRLARYRQGVPARIAASP